MEIEWKDEYSVNNELLDDQHKKFFELVNQWKQDLISGYEEDKIITIINDLIMYAKTHFQEEERLLITQKHPNHEDHVKEHKYFLDKILQFSNDMANGDEMTGVNITGFLGDWIETHVKGSDLDCKDAFKSKKSD